MIYKIKCENNNFYVDFLILHEYIMGIQFAKEILL